MEKVFEDYFSDLQADMVSVCLEYVQNKADMIFIYGSYEMNTVVSEYFYKIDGVILERNKLNDIVHPSGFWYDVSADLQVQVLDILNENIIKIAELCKEYGREIPTELKMIYDVSTKGFKADYQYDTIYSKDPYKTANDIANEWYEEVKNGESQ